MGRRRVDLRTAAALLGISSDAVRKRAKRGTMPHETGADGKLYVWVDTGEPTGETGAYPPGDSGALARELADELRDRVQSLENQLDKEREASSELRRIIAAMTSRIPELQAPPAPRDAPENAAPPRPGTDAPAGDTEPEKRSWWRRFFGFE
jgi:hypothetical protein